MRFHLSWYIKRKRKRKEEKAYIPNEDKKRCSIEFNDDIPESIKNRYISFFEKKGLYDLKSFNEYLKREGRSKVADELHDELKDDPEYAKWSVNLFFKDTLELCIRKSDGSLKEWVIDEALKQSILTE